MDLPASDSSASSRPTNDGSTCDIVMSVAGIESASEDGALASTASPRRVGVGPVMLRARGADYHNCCGDTSNCGSDTTRLRTVEAVPLDSASLLIRSKIDPPFAAIVVRLVSARIVSSW